MKKDYDILSEANLVLENYLKKVDATTAYINASKKIANPAKKESCNKKSNINFPILSVLFIAALFVIICIVNLILWFIS